MKRMNLKKGRRAGKGIVLMLAVSLLCSLLSAVPVYATGEGTMDGGGGGMGQGTSQNKWTPGYDG